MMSPNWSAIRTHASLSTAPSLAARSTRAFSARSHREFARRVSMPGPLGHPSRSNPSHALCYTFCLFFSSLLLLFFLNVACLASFATETVMQICHGRRRCNLAADANTFGTPCQPNSRMYLKVVYTCGKCGEGGTCEGEGAMVRGRGCEGVRNSRGVSLCCHSE